MEAEKRQFARAACEIESSFKDFAGDLSAPVSETVVRDISEGGIRFRANRFVSIHQRLFFKINVPNQKPIEAVAQPAWIREVPSVNQYDIGAKFISLSDSDRDIIREFAQGVFERV